jgi:hypothetical protein
MVSFCGHSGVFRGGSDMTAKLKHWQDPANFIIGLWLMASPWVLAFDSDVTPTANAVIFGFFVAGLALLAMLKVMVWEELVSVVLGVWLAVSPWVLGFTGHPAALWNAAVAGVLVALLALWVLGSDKDIGGWWHPAT